MFEDTNRSMKSLQVSRIDPQYVCVHCGGDRRKGPFTFDGRKRVVGCCRVAVAEKAGVAPADVNVCQSFISD